MKKRILLLCTLLTFITLVQAVIRFDPTKKYRITCGYKNYTGGVVIGPEHNSIIHFLYMDDVSNAEDAWWYIQKNNNGYYTIQNAKTKQYMKFTDIRIVTKIKGLMLADAICGDSTSWRIESYDNNLTITSIENSNKWLHLRSDGSNLLGVYYVSEDPGLKSSFKIYDEDGNEVVDSALEPVDPEDYGTNEEGECWEKSGLDIPIVYTTDTDEPILYRIKNIHSNKFVSVGNDGHLIQTEDDGSQFYFIKGNNGVNIYSDDGKFVSGDTDFSENDFIKIKEGHTVNAYNLWGFDYYNNEHKGYGIFLVKDNGMGSIPALKYWSDKNETEINYGDFNEGSTYIFYSKNKYHKRYLEEQGMVFSTPSIRTLSNYVETISFNDKEAIYDQRNNIYMVPTSTEYRDKDFTPIVRFTIKEGIDLEGATLVIGEDTLSNRQTTTLENVNGTKKYNIQLLNKEKQPIAEDYFLFDFLPIVEITLSSCNGNNYTFGAIKVHDGSSKALARNYTAKYKYRGATAQQLQKKSFNVKITDDSGEKMDVRFFGLRSDNSWVLDAMGVDYSRMRNRVGTDLWNDFSHPQYYKNEEPKALNGTRGRFVEVIMNGEYHGLYCMTEKIDRKQLNLQKYVPATNGAPSEIHGLLYKSKQWSYTVLMGHEPGSDVYPGTAPSMYKNTNSWWNSFEAKYPDLEDGEEIDWKPLYDAICSVASNNENQFIEKVYNYFDLNVLLDYSLFIELLMSTDNHGKNMYYSIYDKTISNKLNVSPWDLDGTFGRDWYGRNNRTEDASQDYDIFMMEKLNGGMGIYHRLKNIAYFSWDKDVAERYRQLRENQFNPDSLCSRFERYASLFADAGADIREKERWNGANGFYLNIPEEIPYITNWLRERIKSMDEKYEYDAVVSNLDRFIEKNQFAVSGRQGYLLIRSEKAQVFRLYNLSGQLIRSVQATKGLTRVDHLTPGIYLIAGKKVIVE